MTRSIADWLCLTVIVAALAYIAIHTLAWLF